MAKKKEKQKYQAQNFFAFNRSERAMYHPNYVFAKIGNRYKSFGLTHHPKKEYPYHELSHNPNPKDSGKSYLQRRVLTTPAKHFGKPLSGWKFHEDDVSYVRRQKKVARKVHKKRR